MDSNDPRLLLSVLFRQSDWGLNPDHLDTARVLLREHSHLAQEEFRDDSSYLEFPLCHVLRYRDITTEDLQFFLDLYPAVLERGYFLHRVCATDDEDDDGIQKHVIEFFAKNCTDAISKELHFQEERFVGSKLPIELYWEIKCRRNEPMEAESTEYWKEVREVSDLLWVEGGHEHMAVERECWPLVSYLKSKHSFDSDELYWFYKPPQGTLSAGALEVMDQFLLPKGNSNSLVLQLPAQTWSDQGTLQVLCRWIQYHTDLRTLHMDLYDDALAQTILPRFTSNDLFESLASNQSLEDLRIGNFHASWDSFAGLLQNAPQELSTWHLSVMPREFHETSMVASTSPSPTSSLQKLRLFQINLDAQCFQDLMQLLTSLPHLIDLELNLRTKEYADYGMESTTTKAMVNFLEQGRLQKLTFGPYPLAVQPMCKLLKENQSLEYFSGFFHADKTEDFQELVKVMKCHNRTLVHYEDCEEAVDGVDKTMGGLREQFIFYLRFNQAEGREELGHPQATTAELLDFLLIIREFQKLLVGEWAHSLLGSEVAYFYELLRHRPMLWARPSE